MKAKPVKLVQGEGYVHYVQCSIEEATHVSINIPGPNGVITLPIIGRSTREGTGGWNWNGSVDSPTLNPSVLTINGHFMADHSGRCWCDYNREHPDDQKVFECFRCHTWITDGKAQFLEDCSHQYRGQTLDLLDVP